MKKLSSKKTGLLVLGQKHITLEDVFEVAQKNRRVELSSAAVKRIQKAHSFLTKKAASGEVIYGVNTGFGILSNAHVESRDIAQLQVNLLRSHAVGTGEPLSREKVRAMMVLRAVSLTQGHSGASLEVVQGLLDFLNQDVTPWIPEQGSVGASGDLAPLSHLALVLIGEGKALLKDKWVPSKKVLDARKLKPVTLGPKEGLALINGTQFMSALATFAVLEAEQLMRVANQTAALSLEAMRGTVSAFDPKIHSIRPHPGQIEVAKTIRSYLGDSKPSQIAESHVDCTRVQDPYSLRCIPQVVGMSLDTLRFVRGIVERELNSVTDNPLIFVEQGQILSGGNFHGQYLSMGMDFLCIAMAELASISERRIEKLINPAFSDLPAFLMKKSGLNSGFMIVQYSAASLVSENKGLCHPASVDSIPTSCDKEDHVSMGAWAARKCLMVTGNVRKVLAMELLAAAQGIDLLRPLKSTPFLEKLHAQVRKRVPYYEEDAPFYEAIEALRQLTYEW